MSTQSDPGQVFVPESRRHTQLPAMVSTRASSAKAPPPAQAPADRTRRYRARQRAGISILRVPVPDYDLIEAMIEAQRITVAGALDRKQVEHAAGEVLAEWASHWLQKV